MTMKPWVFIRLTLLIIFMVASVGATWASSLAFTQVLPSTKAAYQIQQLPPDRSGSEIINLLVELSEKHNGAHIATFVAPGPGQPLTLYTTSEKQEYRGILPTQNLATASLIDLPQQDPRQLFLLSGNNDFQRDVAQSLEQQQVIGDFLEIQEWQVLLSGTDLARFIFLGIVTAAAMMFLGMIAYSKGVGVSRLHGKSWWEIVVQLLKKDLAIFAILFVLAWLPLLLMRGWIAASYFARYFLLAATILLIFALCGLVAGLVVVYLKPIIPTIKGRLATKSLLGVSAVLRIAMVAVALSWCVAAGSYAKEFKFQQGELGLWQQQMVTYKVEITGARTLEARADMQQDFATVMRAMSDSGRVFVHDYWAPRTHNLSDNRAPIVRINRNTAAQMLKNVPLYSDLEQHNDQVLIFSHGQHPLAGQDVEKLVPTCASEPHRCQVMATDDDYETFTWQTSPSLFKPRSLVSNPVVVVYPNDLFGMSDRDITSLLSQGKVTFDSIDSVYEFGAADERFSNLLVDVRPLTHKWLDDFQELKTTRLMAFVATALSLLLIVAFGFFYGHLLIIGYRQRLQVSRIFGVSSLKFYQIATIWDLAVIAGAIVVLWRQTAMYRMLGSAEFGPLQEEFRAAFYLSPVALAVLIGVMVLSGCISLMTIRRSLMC